VGDPLLDDRARAVGQAEKVEPAAQLPASVIVLVELVGFDEVAEQLAHEERVAAGVSAQRLDERGGGRVEAVAGGRREEVAELVVAEARELEPLGRWRQRQRGDVGSTSLSR